MAKKYKLKPGSHQFVPRSHPVHHNNNLTDEEAEWYLEKYPHIKSLFDTIPEDEQTNPINTDDKISVESTISVKSEKNEDLFTAN